MLLGKNIVKLAKKSIKEEPEVFDALLEFEKTGRVPKFTRKKRIDFTLDTEVLRKFKYYCEKNNLKMSNVIENLIRDNILKKYGK